jgi:RNA polymerase sigma-70 factor (ECF subfamily)
MSVAPPRSRSYAHSRPETSPPTEVFPLLAASNDDPPLEGLGWIRRSTLIELMLSLRDHLHHVADREIGRDLDARGDAWDMVQETCLEAVRDLDKFHGTTKAEFLCWLRRILIHNVRSFARRQRALADREVSVDPVKLDLSRADDLETTCPSGAAIRTERARKLREALERLPDRDRLSVLLRSQEDRTFREIGESLGCSAVAARKLWLRVRERLRHELRAC